MEAGDHELVFLHFNDVYHISDPGLVARFSGLLEHISASLPSPSSRRPIRVFSGDSFSPSLEASVLRGDHMVPILNALGTDVACYGNHDFDFGEEILAQLFQKTNFPWVMSNMFRPSPAGSLKTGVDKGVCMGEKELMAGAHKYVVKQVGSVRVGFFGLAGTDWPSNCQHLPACTIASPENTAREVATLLRSKECCHVVIAVTHARLAEDLRVAAATEEGPGKVDLILGGHDHDVLRRMRGDTNSYAGVIHDGKSNEDVCRKDDGSVERCEGDVRVVKSGTDWKGVSTVRMKLRRDGDGEVCVETISVDQIYDIRLSPLYSSVTPNPVILSEIFSIHETIQSAVQNPLFHSNAPLDGRSSIIRSQETNLGNMLADAARAFYNTDISFVNSGAVRCDRILPASSLDSPLTVRDAIDILPFYNCIVVKKLPGKILREALENSFSDRHLDGRFLQISGLSVIVSWGCPEGQRVKEAWWSPSGVDGEKRPLEGDRWYDVAMTQFIADGFDGYTCFKDGETVLDAEGAMTDTELLLEVLGRGVEAEGDLRHKGNEGDKAEEGVRRSRAAVLKGYSDEHGLPVVEPVVDGRIRVTGSV
ncbi:5'-nucleotidase [Zalerion maritima]|uniref:5'-nucleotidase n=1 Tax=Zalerion maritima TaxID=339359 RepID=A0AAD5WVH5_9PEZI|nr:5'-nucleotidase [Zalerion maritima]